MFFWRIFSIFDYKILFKELLSKLQRLDHCLSKPIDVLKSLYLWTHLVNTSHKCRFVLILDDRKTRFSPTINETVLLKI